MPTRRRRFVVLALGLLAVMPTACVAGRRMREGRLAEQAGDYPQAYELYCRVVEDRPTDRAAAAAIARVSAPAARYWEGRARAAEAGGDLEVAWQAYMQALTIRPDLTTVFERIRALERDHPGRLADLRRQYQARGPVALVIAGPSTQPSRPGPQMATRDVGGDETERPPASPARDTPRGVAATGPPRTSGLQSTAQARPATPSPPRPSEPLRERPPAPPRVEPPLAAEPSSVHVFTGIVSRDDERYPKTCPAVDGLSIKLRDTDHGPDADVDVYRGSQRVTKYENLVPGQSVRVRGRSGREYEMVILDIHDPTETVRFAIRAAAEPTP